MMLAAVVVVAAGVQAARPVLTPILLAALITMATAPLLAFLRNRRVPDGVAVTMVLIGTLCGVTFLGLLVGSSVDSLVRHLPKYEEALRSGLQGGVTALAGYGIEMSMEWAGRVLDPGPMLAFAGRALQGVANVVSMTFLVLLVVAFMLVESLGLRAKLERIALSSVQIDELKRASMLVDRYLAVKTAVSVLTGVLIGVWNYALGIELAMLWGVLAFLLNFVPTIGSIMAALPVVALTALEGGAGQALLLASGYLAVNFVIGNGLEPKVMGAVLGLSPLVVFFSLLWWGFLLGPVGALVSVPLTIIVRILAASMPDAAWLAVLLGPPQPEDVVTASLPPPPMRGSDDGAAV